MLILAALLLQVDAPIHLVCYGGGEYSRQVNSYGVVTSGMDEATFTTTKNVSEDYEDQVRLEITGAVGKIRVPNAVKPPIRYGGQDGWYPLKKIETTDDEIRAKVSLNFMNNPEVRLDRITGYIEISGKNGSFSGRCAKYSPDSVERKF